MLKLAGFGGGGYIILESSCISDILQERFWEKVPTLEPILYYEAAYTAIHKGFREAVQQRKCLPRKCKDQSSDPKHACTCQQDK